MLRDDDLRRPRELHPAFYGCFDWHSAVHGHWMLARLARAMPALPERSAIHRLFDETLTPETIAVETAYFAERPAFERTYGWAWLLQLARELVGTRWGTALEPLAHRIAELYVAFLPRQTYPIRTGVHANTAFGLAFALDYARATPHRELERMVIDRALHYYASDRDAPAAWEPSGEDFLSPSLVEADLMRRVLPAADFAPWLHAFLPALPTCLQQPVVVTDPSDGKLAHLGGLNLSRAWCLHAIARALPDGDPLRASLASAADAHAATGLASVWTGDYAGEHWLASFAVYLLGAIA
jgi:hypothetical protein